MGYRVPAFSYPGGKAKLREWMVRKMPMSGEKYVEPFAGRGNVFWLAVHMLDFREWWLNDPCTARWFEAIQSVNLGEIPKKLDARSTRMYHERAKSRDDNLSVALEPEVNFAGGVYPRSGIKSVWRVRPSLSGFVERLKNARAILKSIRPNITSLDWKECDLGSLGSKDFVYMDPPYRSAARDLYTEDSVDHLELVRYLIDAPHLWMLSEYDDPLYSRWIGPPIGRKRSFLYVSKVQPDESRRIVEECLWTNYTIGADGIPKRKRLKMRRISKKAIGK